MANLPRVSLTLKSRNPKTGPIPVSTTAESTCPASCPLKRNGCYAEGGPLALQWRKVSEGRAGMAWEDFLQAVRALPPGTPWRHNQAGDLPGQGDRIDANAMRGLVMANVGRGGFTYTHKPVMSGPHAGHNAAAVLYANLTGFTVNLSANTLAEADALAAMRIAPVVVVLDAVEGARHDVTTPEGRRVVTCPATYKDSVTCASCLLCAKPHRRTIVGFPAHGAAKKRAAAVACG